MKYKVIFVFPLPKELLMELPSNFSYYIKEIMRCQDFDVCFINSEDYSGGLIKRTLKMIRDINKEKADILYLNLWMGYNNLVIAKILGFIKCKIVTWKYTYCVDSDNCFKHLFYKYIYWRSVDMVYMMFDNHTADAINRRLLDKSRIVTLSRGVDLDWYSSYIKKDKEAAFIVVASGQDHRDYLTLAKACEETKTKLEIVTYHKYDDVANKFKNSKYVHFDFIVNGYKLENYRHVVDVVSKSSVMAICCEKLPYGAGYTNIIECLAFKIPILQTQNPDVHLDPEVAGIGFSIKPYDVEDWKQKILLLREHADLRKQMAAKIDELISKEYNSKVTANYIVNDFRRLLLR